MKPNNTSSHKPKKKQTVQAWKHTVLYYLWLLPPLVLFLLIYGVFTYTNHVQKAVDKAVLNPIEKLPQTSYPVLKSTIKSTSLFPDLSAQASIVLDDKTGVMLFGKNERVTFPMASTTKIMTALVALEHYNLDDVLTVYSVDVPPAVVGFTLGQQVRFKDMLYGMLINSGNDAALAIAQNYPGGESAFVVAMNAKAQEFSLENTHYEDSSGLSPFDYTTPLDLARLSSLAMKNPIIASIVGTKNATITNLDGSSSYSLANINKLLGSDGVIGIKTGFTDEAGEVLSTAMEEKGHRYIIVVMKSDDRFGDTKKLLTFLSGNVSYLPFGTLEE